MNKNPYDYFAGSRRWASKSFTSETAEGSDPMRRIMFIVPICALVLLAVSVFLITEYSDNSRILFDSWQDRDNFYFHADELHQNYEDLTRMARSYAATGDERYLGYHQAIQDIQAGKLPRPRDYNLAYWDFVLDSNSPLGSSGQLELEGQTVPLLDLLVETGVDGNEASLLHEAELNSSVQIEMESSAIVAAQTGNSQEANDLLYSAEYLRAKAQVMNPLLAAVQSYDEGSLSEISELESRNNRLRVELLVIVSLLIFFVVGSFVLAFFIPHSGKKKPEEETEETSG